MSSSTLCSASQVYLVLQFVGLELAMCKAMYQSTMSVTAVTMAVPCRGSLRDLSVILTLNLNP